MPADLNDYFKKKMPSGGGSNKSGGGGSNFEPPEFFQNFGKKAGLLYALIFIIALIVIAKPFAVINSGEVGIKVTAGKYESQPLTPGLHFYVPFVQNIITVDTKVRSITYSRNETTSMANIRQSGVLSAPAITTLDARGLIISIDATIQYRLKEESAPQTIATYGLAWEEKIINPIVRDVVRNVIGQYKAEELPIKRNAIAKLLESQIRDKIASKQGNPVELATVNLREIILPEKIKEQIERVQIAKQEGDRVKLEVERAKQEAEKKAALAHGEAEAKKIIAKGRAEATKIEADANAYANIEISKSLTNKLLDLRQIEVQGKFNDALRENKDSKIFLTPGGSVPNIWIDSKSREKTTSMNQ